MAPQPQTVANVLAHLKPLLRGDPPAAPLAGAGTAITAVTADSRAVQPGTLFVAVAGGRADGHAWLADALAKGAPAVVGTRPADELAAAGLLPAGAPYIQVENSREALAQVSALLCGFPSRDLIVVGVTGTDGKTTTSTLLEAILVEATRSAENPDGAVGVVTTVGARIRGVENDTGFHVTTPDAPEVQRFLADMRDSGCRYAVVESTSHGLDQRRVGAVEFDVAVVTNITHEHLDYHGTREAYVAAKARLFRSLYASVPKPGVPRVAVINADDGGSCPPLVQALAEERYAKPSLRDGVAIRSYSAQGSEGLRADVWAEGIAARPDGTHWLTHWWGGAFELDSPLIGMFNVSNVLAATTAALALEIPPEVIARTIRAFPGVLGRMERMSTTEPFLALVDFAHTPVSLERALETLRPLVGAAPDGTPGRLIAIFGSAGLRDRAKRKWMGQISGRLADYTIITAEDPRTEDLAAINAEIESGVRESVGADRYRIVPDRTEAIQAGIDMARPGDIVASFGKGHERSMCFGEVEYPWSDQDAMRAALANRAAREQGA